MKERYLIDTHVLIWYMQGDERLSKNAIARLNEPSNVIWISQVSLWEITIKVSMGRLTIGIPFTELEDYLIDKGFLILDFNFADLISLQALPYHHSDPFDRLIIAQSQTNKLPVISDDSKFKLYEILLIPV
ncbi:PIN domain-containing protein [Spirosoma sp. HMF3257]|uniref:Type II toxin-antitoxin system VapC family toxin n=1 Tax=Spirosoma telluris TaxID=2183553 RepID=A0A327NQ33_9BACT|nr:PIN domain-containing protein [Spirosoma telluris]RAI77372.1 type II toxin-antitoxin system VapC family toxin [Spirosoma telluris]